VLYGSAAVSVKNVAFPLLTPPTDLSNLKVGRAGGHQKTTSNPLLRGLKSPEASAS
jgi:hypothetical protein